MKIKRKRKEEKITYYKDLCSGDVFEWSGNFYFKIMSEYGSRAANLENGQTGILRDLCRVTPISGSFVFEEE